MINVDNVMDMLPPPPDESNNNVTNNTIKLPLLGRIHFVRDQEGQFFASVVVIYWLYGTFPTLAIILLPAYNDGLISAPVVVGFLLVSGLCIMSFVRASLTNPGRVPKYPASGEDDAGWVRCKTCCQMRPQRAHHCRRCGQCVLKMDHHCPWINNCVGESNHFAFMQLLFYAFLLGLYTFCLVMLHFWVFPKCVSCDREAFYIKHSIWFMYLSFILSLNMMVMMGVQFSQQHINLLLNKTTLETMISPTFQGAELRKCYHSYRELCGEGWSIFWLFPIGRRRPRPSPAVQHPV